MATIIYSPEENQELWKWDAILQKYMETVVVGKYEANNVPLF